MKRMFSLAAVLVFLASTAIPEPQIPAPASTNGIITTGSGTSIRLVPNPSTAPPIRCNSMLIQFISGTGPIYILNAPVNITMAYGSAGTTKVGTLNNVGDSFTFPSNGTSITQTGGFNLALWGAYDATSGDTFSASCDVRQ